MPLYIGDYLADTMHLSTQQHGAYLLLLFHLWRRGTLPDDDGALAKITGLSGSVWANTRPVLAEFFKIQDGQWRHGRVERERLRVAAKQEYNAKKARSAANKRWGNAPSIAPEDAPGIEPENAPSIAPSSAPSIALGNAPSIAQAVPGDAEPQPEPQPKPELSGKLFPDDLGAT